MRLETLPAVARSIPLVCGNCDAERFFKVIAHISNLAAKAKCEVCGRSKTLRVGEDMSDESANEGAAPAAKAKGAQGSSGKEPKEKKPRNLDGLKAANEKRRAALAEKKAEVAAKKEADLRAEYEKQYETLKNQIGTAKVVPYKISARFEVANAIQHAKFGLGFVTSASSDRIEVAFVEGVKPLVHNRG